MSSNSSGEDEEYYRVAIVTSEHPAKPLEGTVVAISTSLELSVPDPLFDNIIEMANEKFEIDQYANGLRLGTIYFNANLEEAIGICWAESPCTYSHGDFDEPVETLPEDIISTNELLL